ncbi:glutaminase A, partial [Mesorhizobium sp.]
MPELEQALTEIAAEMAERTDRGEVATYIPQLGKVDPNKFGIAAVTKDGRVLIAGDADEPFSIQSISKVFTLTLALGNVGDALWQRVGREPSGNPFNSIVQLEHENGIPRNPFINAGAIVISDILLAGHQPREAIGEILRFIQFLADDETIIIDREVAASERATGFRNLALANYMKSFGNLNHAPDLALGVYFHHCAIAMSCRQLALAGRFLA